MTKKIKDKRTNNDLQYCLCICNFHSRFPLPASVFCSKMSHNPLSKSYTKCTVLLSFFFLVIVVSVLLRLPFWYLQTFLAHTQKKTEQRQIKKKSNTTQKTKMMSNTDPIKNTTQKTKMMTNTDHTKKSGD
jgi:cytoskeletal protein RodZ